MRRWGVLLPLLAAGLFAPSASFPAEAQPHGSPNGSPSASDDPLDRPNIVFILIDDQRYDALSLLGHPFLETPHLDELARGGILFENAFVTTSLCSPSRASILTGLYAHRHQVLDNSTPLDPKLPTFPRALQESGYRTAFIGKWHMGGFDDRPRPGFDRWVSFPDQGVYVDPTFNIDGRRVEHQGYTTDLLTDNAVAFLEQQDGERPFFLYLSHKAVHYPFTPAERYRGSYAGESYPHPATMADSEENYAGKPDWVRKQRNSWHGVDGMFDHSVDFDEFVLDYNETLRAVDDSVGRVVETLRRGGLLERTLLVFTSDNGFQFGEHGLIDKRTMYEASIRVPLIVHAPALIPASKRDSRRSEMILNLDFAPTFLEAAGLAVPDELQGLSFLGLLSDEAEAPWRDAFLYEYFWERMFPQTPTVLGVRTDRYKLMRYHGIWDRYELYDLEQDPEERHNLIGEYVTRTRVGNVKQRVLGSPVPIPALVELFGEGSSDEELKELYRSLSRRLDELLTETGSAAEPNWVPLRSSSVSPR